MTHAKTANPDRTAAEPAPQVVPEPVPKKPAPRVRTPRASQTAAAAGQAASAAVPKAPVPPVAAGAAKPKQKLVRDSFAIPKSEYAVLDALKFRAAQLKRPTKKSEVLRAGIAALDAMNDKAFLSAINGVPSLKTGRPKATTPPAKTAAARQERHKTAIVTR